MHLNLHVTFIRKPWCKDSANREQNQIYLNYARVQPVFAVAKELMIYL